MSETSEPLLEPGAGGVAGLRFPALSIRTRLISGGPRNALATRYDPYSPLEIYFDDLRDDYLAGRIKTVMNFYHLRNAQVFHSHSIVPAPTARTGTQAKKNRRDLIDQLERQYFSAIARAVAKIENMNPKALKRLRHRANTALIGGRRFKTFETVKRYEPAKVAAYFARWPAAVEAASGIAALIEKIERLDR